MLPKKLKFSSKDHSKVKAFKSKKLITKYGFFVILEETFGGKKSIITSSKNFKTAVLRNKVRRLFYNTLANEDSIMNKSFVLHAKKEFTGPELLVDLLKI
jgi:ribonuclease P protein component